MRTRHVSSRRDLLPQRRLDGIVPRTEEERLQGDVDTGLRVATEVDGDPSSLEVTSLSSVERVADGHAHDLRRVLADWPLEPLLDAGVRAILCRPWSESVQLDARSELESQQRVRLRIACARIRGLDVQLTREANVAGESRCAHGLGD